MKWYTRIIKLHTKHENDMVDITNQVMKIVRDSNVKNGLACIFVKGSTGAVTTIEYEPGLKQDLPDALERIAPKGVYYKHHETWHDDNGHSHVRASLIGPSLTIPFRNGKIIHGTWQQFVFLELDTSPRDRNIIVQIIGVRPEGDVTYVSAYSGELKKYGWKGGRKNTPSAYLVGYLAGLKALRKGIKEAILDIGLHRPTRGAKLFAATLGGIHAGLKIPIGKEVLPSEDRIKGVHIASYAKLLKEKSEESYSRQFSSYLKEGFNPEDIPTHFEEVKKNIESSFKEGK